MSQPILCGLDFSPDGRRALEVATSLAIDLHVPLVVVHAFPAARYAPVLLGARGAQASADEHAAISESEAIELSQEWAEWARQEGAEVVTVAEDDNPVDLVLATAAKVNARMIVVGTRGHGPMARWVFGSVSTTLSDRADRPVLIVD